MADTLLDSYRRIEQRQYIMAVCMTLSTIITLILLLLYSQLFSSNSQTVSLYSSLQTGYAVMNSSLHTQLLQLNVTLAKSQAADSQIAYNLTNPYTKSIYKNYQVNIPKRNQSVANTTTKMLGPIETFNTTSATTYYTYNFSFDAPYSGYLIINATSTAVNSNTNASWEFIVSNGKALQNATIKYYNFESGGYYQSIYTQTVTSSGIYRTNQDQGVVKSIYAPLPSQIGTTVKIPITNGTVRVWIANFENQSISVTFSADYVGFHTN